MTLPLGTVALLAIVTVPSTRPAPVIALVAAGWVNPTTFGTDTITGPLETTKLTAEPKVTLVPAVGLSEITRPDATVALDCEVTAPTVSPAPVSVLVAEACVIPTTFGTATLGGPLETTKFTPEPDVTIVPAAGLSEITSPEATVALD